MMKKNVVFSKLRAALQEMGVDLISHGSFHEVEYKGIVMLLNVNEADGTFSICTYVFDTNGSLNEQTLNVALDVIDDLYECYSGGWNDGVPYFASPAYIIGKDVEVTAEWLEMKLKEFWDVFMFLLGNIHLMGDKSLFPEMTEKDIK